MKRLLQIAPWLALALFAADIIAIMLPKRDGEFHWRAFGRLPVLSNGRMQPFDSVGRNALLQIRSTGDLPLEQVPSWQFWHHPKKLTSTEWLLEALFRPEVADTRPVFLIHHPELVSDLKLEKIGVEKSGLRYYTFRQIEPMLEEIDRQATAANAVEPAQRTAYQKQALKLANAIALYRRLKNSIQPEGTDDFSAFVAEYQSSLAPGLKAFRDRQAGQPADQAALAKFTRAAQQADRLASLAYLLVVPPRDRKPDPHAWVNVGTSLLGSIQSGEIHPAVVLLARMAGAYGRQDAAEFNGAVAAYRDLLEPHFARELGRGRAEHYFNQLKLFKHGLMIYVAAFLAACGALLTAGMSASFSGSMRRSAFYLIVLAFAVHTFAMIFRMALEGRPPVTNLYSSAIFIGWAACLLGLVLEAVFRVGLGSAVAGLTGFVTLLIAHNLAMGGDTMEPMRAVLDNNFWLTTHVLTITLGYAAMFVAGALAAAYVILGVFTPLLKRQLGMLQAGAAAFAGTGVAGAAATMPHARASRGGMELGKVLANMVYGVICFATLFSFVGTVLGGIWADQSWGRFWGWDPKENGALLIVLWTAIMLHARWGGLVRERGLMNLAMFGNIITAFSWFGVNMLGIGLHSYGFMDEAFKWLMLFFVSQAMFIGLGSVPLRFWKSRPALPPPVPGAGEHAVVPNAPPGERRS